MALLATLTVFWLRSRPLPAGLQTPLPGTLTLLDCRGREIAEIASPEARSQIPIELGAMGEWLPRVTVAIEDHRFYRHAGIDWRAGLSAFVRNLTSGRVVSGGSTITQQLVKMAHNRRQRTLAAKLGEGFAAWNLERRWGKDRILTEYLNRLDYGNRRLGPEAAARAYFGKSAQALTLAEAIFLAGLPQSPTRLNPWRHPDESRRRYARSVQRLAQRGMITPDQEARLRQSPPIARRFDPPRHAPHFVDTVRSQHPAMTGTVKTTLDLELQSAVEQTLRTHLAALNRYDVTEAAVVVLDNASSAVRALVGSSNYDLAQINGATRPRSAGSTLKPFVYLAAIDRRVLTAASLLPDTPDAIRGEYHDYDPHNFNRRSLGPVRVREALGCSLNVPAIMTLSRIGARPAFQELRRWGFEFPGTLEDYGAGFLLGNAEVRLIDLAAAYAGLAQGGLVTRARCCAFEYPPLSRVASSEATGIIIDILCDNGARQKSFGTHSPLAFEERVAAKTGTSSGFRDAWTVGFDQDHTVAVWAGNFDGRPMRDTLAVRSATPLWAELMRQLLRRDHPLPPPDANLVRCEICKVTGLLPSRFSTTRLTELFLKGTEPAQSSDAWFSDDGRLLLPAEYATWCASPDNTIGASIVPELRITNPVAHACYQMDAVLPLRQQMIEFTSTLGRSARWFVNGEPVQPQADGRFFWQLAPGNWELRVVGGGSTACTGITVE